MIFLRMSIIIRYTLTQGKEYASFSKTLCESNAEAEGAANVSFGQGDATKLKDMGFMTEFYIVMLVTLVLIIAFLIFFIIQSAAQITAFVKGYTPYPKWCWIFSLPVGMTVTMLIKFAGNHALFNALAAGWISIGNIWMFGGLLFMMKKAKEM